MRLCQATTSKAYFGKLIMKICRAKDFMYLYPAEMCLWEFRKRCPSSYWNDVVPRGQAMTVAKRLGGDSEVVSLKVMGTTFT